MSIGTALSGLTEQTPEYLVVHTGMMIMNANIAELEASGGSWVDATNPINTWEAPNGEIVKPEPFGATRQGFTIDPAMTIEPIDVDGTIGPVIGLDQVTEVAPVISGRMVEMGNGRRFKQCMGAADVTKTDSGLFKIQPRSTIKKTDYLGNIAIFCSTYNSKTSDYWVVVLHNPLGGIQRHELQRGQANDVPVAFGGRAPLSDPGMIPITYYIPDIAGSGSGS